MYSKLKASLGYIIGCYVKNQNQKAIKLPISYVIKYYDYNSWLEEFLFLFLSGFMDFYQFPSQICFSEKFVFMLHNYKRFLFEVSSCLLFEVYFTAFLISIASVSLENPN